MDLRAEIAGTLTMPGIPEWVVKEMTSLLKAPLPDHVLADVLETYLHSLPAEGRGILPHRCSAWCVGERHVQQLWVGTKDTAQDIHELLCDAHRIDLMNVILIEPDRTSPPVEVVMKDAPEFLAFAVEQQNTAPWRIFFTIKEGFRCLPRSRGGGGVMETYIGDSEYRYLLTRGIEYFPIANPHGMCNGGTMLFIMLNPSTADDTLDDPTIRRCRGFAVREGASSLQVVNLFAYRATDPRVLNAAASAGQDIVGVKNYPIVQEQVLNAGLVVCAWGTRGYATAPLRRATERSIFVVQNALKEAGKVGYCLGRPTKEGMPRHPLYAHSFAALNVWHNPANHLAGWM